MSYFISRTNIKIKFTCLEMEEDYYLQQKHVLSAAHDKNI